MRYVKPLSLAIMALSSSVAFGQTIENAGFEDGMDGWTEVDPASISGVRYNGSNSLKIDGSPARVHQWVDVIPGASYTLTAYVRGVGQIGVNDKNGLFRNKKFDESDWTQVSVNFTNANETSLQVFAKHNNNSDSVRFDDFDLTLNGAAPTPVPTPTPSPVPTPTPTPAPTPSPTPQASEAFYLQHESSGNYYALNSSNQLQASSSINSAQVLEKVAKDGGYAFRASGGAMDGMYSYEPSGANRQEMTADYDAAEVFYENDCGDGVVYFLSATTGQSLKNESNSMLGNGSGGDCGSSANEFTWVSANGSTPTPVPTPTPTPATPTPSPTPTPTPTPQTGESCDIDMTIWGYTVGDAVSRNSQDDIQDLVDNKTLGGDEITWENGCPTFKVNNIADSSENSPFSRSELRELQEMYLDDGPDDTDIENQWVTSKYTGSDRSKAGGIDGTMTATLKVNTVSVDQNDANDQVGRIIVGQIHGVDHEPVKIYYQKLPEHTNGSVFFTVDGSDGKPIDRVYVLGYSDKDYSRHAQGKVSLENPADGIALGETWSYEIDLTGDQLKVTVIHDGDTYTTADSIAYTRWFKEEYDQDGAMISNSSDTNAITVGSHYDNDWMYFKAGLYNQNNTGTASPAYASVTFYQIDVTHD